MERIKLDTTIFFPPNTGLIQIDFTLHRARWMGVNTSVTHRFAKKTQARKLYQLASQEDGQTHLQAALDEIMNKDPELRELVDYCIRDSLKRIDLDPDSEGTEFEIVQTKIYVYGG